MKKSKPVKTEQRQHSAGRSKPPAKDISMWLIGIAVLFALVAYLPSLKFEFVNWDDTDYVTENTTIHSLSNFKALLTVPVQGNYHPLTMLSLAVNYAMSGDKAGSYHFLNLLFHLLNIFLVFKLAAKLSGNTTVIPFATALLFGIHPMHVESVAWISERKDVLYAFFFLLGLLSYLKYIDSSARKDYLLCILWFLLSLASKPAAIIFPVALFTIDFFRKRKYSVSLLTEKIPFFVFSGILTWLTLHAQTAVGATGETKIDVAAGTRFFYGFYGYAAYFFKMVLPINLSTLYPFPAVNKSLPVEYFVSPLFFIATLIVCYATRKKYPVVTFAFAFYLVNLLLILQFKMIGSAVIADRYTYVPYIGLFFLIGWLLNNKFKQKPTTAYAVLGAVGIVFLVMTYNQAATWKNSVSLWDNAIAKTPGSEAYSARADLFYKERKMDQALAYYNEAIKINEVDNKSFSERANIYFEQGKDSLALADFNHALFINPDFVTAIAGRGALYGREGKFDLAIADLSRAIQLNPRYKDGYRNRGISYFQTKQYENAIHDFEISLTYNAKDADVHNTMGVCYQNLGQYERSVKCFSDAIAIESKPLFYLNRSNSWNSLGKIDEARQDALEARKGGIQISEQYARSLGI